MMMVKRKKYQFQVELWLDELCSVPFINGLLFAKIRLHDGSHTVCSARAEVKDHSVQWKAHFSFACKMSANASSGVLDSSYLRISIRKEVKGGRSSLKLGYVDLDLAEFAGAGRTDKRSLLEGYNNKHHRQDNSTLLFGINVALAAGDPLFKRPTRSTSSFYAPLDDHNGDGSHSGGVGSAGHHGLGLVDRHGPLPTSLPLTASAVLPTVASDVESRVDSTRVNNEELIDRLVGCVADTSIGDNDAQDDSELGLQLFVGKDGTATLGSRSGTNRRKKQSSLVTSAGPGHYRQTSAASSDPGAGEAANNSSASTTMSRHSSGSIPTQSSAEA